MPVSRPWLPWLAFAAISFIWGSTWLAHKWALEDFTPAGLSTIRFSLAAVLCLLLGRLRGEAWPKRGDLPTLLFTGLILTGLANVLTAWSLTHVPSGVGAVLQSPIPVWMALLSMRRDPLSGTGWIAVLLGLGGVVLVMWPQGRSDIPLWPAVVCVLIAALWSWASLVQRARVQSGGLYSNAGIQMAQSAVIGLLLTPIFSSYTHVPQVHLHAWLALGYLVIFGSVIAFGAYLYLTQVWHPARAGSFAYLNPLVAVLLGAWLGSEPLTLRLVMGMTVILAAVAVLQLASRRPRAVPASAAPPVPEGAAV
jgi:drug/metabolite transporter (DMT)-like permease